MTAAERAQTIAVERVAEFMRRRHLTLADLIEYGGEDIPNPKLPEKICDPARIKAARAVERCWELIAELGLTYGALESSSIANSVSPRSRPRRRRGEGGTKNSSKFSTTCPKTVAGPKSNEINDLANSILVGDPDSNSNKTAELAK
jgi:hypothetical protein